MLNSEIDFDLAVFNQSSRVISFENTNISQEGGILLHKYGKKGFLFTSLNLFYFLDNQELCVESVFPLSFKKYWLQPENNSFCFLKNGDMPIFTNATLIKKKRLLKDKLYNNVNVVVKPSLKLSIIND